MEMSGQGSGAGLESGRSDQHRLDYPRESAQVKNMNRKIQPQRKPLSKEMLEVLIKGGITPLLKDMFGKS